MGEGIQDTRAWIEFPILHVSNKQMRTSVKLYSITILFLSSLGWVQNAIAYDQNTFEIQACLKSKGYKPGALDGVHGNSTGNALKQFQSNEGLQVTGRLAPEVKDRLCEGVDLEDFPVELRGKMNGLFIPGTKMRFYLIVGND